MYTNFPCFVCSARNGPGPAGPVGPPGPPFSPDRAYFRLEGPEPLSLFEGERVSFDMIGAACGIEAPAPPLSHASIRSRGDYRVAFGARCSGDHGARLTLAVNGRECSLCSLSVPVGGGFAFTEAIVSLSPGDIISLEAAGGALILEPGAYLCVIQVG